MKKLSIVNNATAIANNVSSLITNIDARCDTVTIRKASNKLAYSLQTIHNGRQLIKYMNYEDQDFQRAEELLDAFTLTAYNDILNSLR